MLAVLARSRLGRGSCEKVDPAVCISVLKPLHGATPETYRCLASFLRQTHACYQLVFGVADCRDPAVDVVCRLQRNFPQRDIILVIDGRQHGANRKVSNLINMVGHARYDILVVSDSDVIVHEDYLSRVAAPLQLADVGIVTCAYRAIPRRDVWSTLAAMFINEWFLPSVSVAAMFGSRSFAFGATIAIRRANLRKVGGFERLANEIADDYRLGQWTRALGLRTVLSPLLVDVVVDDGSLKTIIFHELRWLRTIRVLRPFGYFGSLVTLGPLVTLAGMSMVGNAVWAAVLVLLAVALKIKIHSLAKNGVWRIKDILLLPVRDLLQVLLWAAALMGRRVQWGGYQFSVHRDGSLTLHKPRSRSLPASGTPIVNDVTKIRIERALAERLVPHKRRKTRRIRVGEGNSR